MFVLILCKFYSLKIWTNPFFFKLLIIIVHFFSFNANSVPVTKSDFLSDDLKQYSKDPHGFDQWGSLVGQIAFEDSSTKECFLRGLRQQNCESQNFSKFDKVLTYFGSIYGLTFYLNIGKSKRSSEM